jgi:hypothetical protein
VHLVLVSAGTLACRIAPLFQLRMLSLYFPHVEYKTHNDLPLARIKRIMKSDEEVRMISAEAPVMFAKACEMFIVELTMR